MKFVCENCKAKYQIGDDKVAGRTLRMKCRRCGEMIQVAATVTESSVSAKLPLEPATGSAPEPVRATPPPRPAADGGMSALDDDPNGDDGATVIRRSPFFDMQEKAPESPRPNAPKLGAAPRMGGAPRPAGGPRIVPPARASMRSSAPPPRPSAAGNGALAAVPMHSPSSPGLHAGFVRAVAAAPSAETSPLPTEDWYVGIGGVPLGPVRLAVLRDKAAAGQVDGDSLVWREGFDEWQAIKSIPPLFNLVEEAKQTRASRMSLPAVVAPTPRPAPAGVTPPPSPSPSASPAAPAAALAPAGVPAPAPSVASSLGVPAPAQSLPFDLVRSSSSPVAPAASSPGLMPPPAAPSTPFAEPLATPAAAPGGYGLTTTAGLASSPSPSIAPAPISELSPTSLPADRRRRGLPPAAWALIAMAAAFGGVAAWALFLRQPQTQVAAATPTAQTTGDAPLGASPPPPPSPTGSSVAAEPGATILEPGPGGGAPRPGGHASPGAKTAEPGSPIDRTGFNPTPGGPTADTPPPSGGGALTEGEINGVVSRNKPMITRRCWLPAYDARGPNAPSNAKVSVSLKVGPSGSVTSASAGGSEAHYPGLASCVAGSVKSWTFPPSDEGASINIPFSFSGQ